ncbi:hypothetical protein ACLOJK_037004 [Asimina triloba]
MRTSTNELDLSGVLSSDIVCGKDIALAINGLVFFLSIAMTPRKVPRAIPSVEIKEEQPIFHQLGKGGLLPFFFSHQASNDVTVDVPSMGPWRAVTQGKQYQTPLPTMEDRMDTLHTQTYGLSYPLHSGRNDDDNPLSEPASTP